MGKYDVRTIARHQLMGDRLLADDPMIAVDIKERILQAAESDTIALAVVEAEQWEVELVEEAEFLENVEPQQIRLAANLFRDFEMSLLVLYAVYALAVVSVTTYLLLQWGHVL